MFGLIITKVAVQKKYKGRYSIFIDEEFAFGMTKDCLCKLGLYKGQEITQDHYQEILDTICKEEARNAALNYISYRLRSKMEVENKLRDKEFPAEIIPQIIQNLEEYGYINDVEFGIIYIQSKRNKKPYGIKGYAYQLRKKGLSSDDIEKVFERMCIDEVEDAYTLLKKRYKGDWSLLDQSKMCRYLSQRGFAIYNCKKVIEKMKKEDNK